MGNKFCSRATLRRPRLANKKTDLFDVAEFIAPDVLLRQRTSAHGKKTEVIQPGVPAEG